MDSNIYPTEENELQLIKCKLRHHQIYSEKVKKEQELLEIKVRAVDQQIQELEKMIKQQELKGKEQISQTDQNIYDLQKEVEANDIKIRSLQEQIAQSLQIKKQRELGQLQKQKQMQMFYQYVEKAQRFYEINRLLRDKSKLVNSLLKLIHM